MREPGGGLVSLSRYRRIRRRHRGHACARDIRCRAVGEGEPVSVPPSVATRHLARPSCAGMPRSTSGRRAAVRASPTTCAPRPDAKLDELEDDEESDGARKPRVRQRIVPERGRFDREPLQHPLHHDRERLIRVLNRRVASRIGRSTPPLRATHGGKTNAHPNRRVMLTMNKLIAAAVGATLVLTVAACSSGYSSNAGSTRTAAAVTKTPTPTPTPTAMSIDEAGQYYLGTVCPVNTASGTMNAALVAQNLDAIHASTDSVITTAQDAARRLDDSSVLWPDVIDRADIDSIRDYYLEELQAVNQLKSATALDQVNAIVWPADDSGGGAQRIRLRLNLSADTSQGC